jgi:Protein of unknown function (DUF3175)
MSMLTFYINRAGKNLSDERKRVLESAKNELRKEFGRWKDPETGGRFREPRWSANDLTRHITIVGRSCSGARIMTPETTSIE